MEQHEEMDISCSPIDTSVTPFPQVGRTDHDYGTHTITAEEQLEAARERIAQLEMQCNQLQSRHFFMDRFCHDPISIQFYTGFKDYSTLKAVFLALQPTALTMVRWSQVQRNRNTNSLNGDVFRNESLPLIDQFFMFLCRVRQGFYEQDLAVRFNVSQSTVSRILLTWTNYLYFMLGSLPIWCSREVVDKEMPQCFKANYPKTRVILDCTEINVQTPSSKVLNSETYSHYKGHTTFKSLVGISPFGAITFVSSLYTGCISDKEITARSGILNLLDDGDQVMADKGFLIQDLLSKHNASLVIPPFLGPRGKFTKEEVSETQDIARLRIHVERAIRRIKEFHIFDKVLPLSIAGSSTQLWTVCVLLTNFKGPLF